MSNQVREIQYFFSGQDFSDGLRVTLGILLPALLFSQFGELQLGVMLSIGALSVSIADFPGPPVHKRNGMLLCCLCIFFVAIITGFAPAPLPFCKSPPSGSGTWLPHGHILQGHIAQVYMALSGK